MIRLRHLIKENLKKVLSVPRKAYMELESLLLKRIELLRVKEIIDDLQVIINIRSLK